MKGYFTDAGYCGYVENEGYMLFEDEAAYHDYLKELFEDEAYNDCIRT